MKVSKVLLKASIRLGLNVVLLFNNWCMCVQEGTHKRVLTPANEMHETVRLQESATYQFWVTASTKVGEGDSTRVVTISPSTKGQLTTVLYL